MGYVVHSGAAKTKAALIYNRAIAQPTSWVKFIGFWAESHAEAGRVIQARILPGDDRLIMGRSNVGLFAREADEAGNINPTNTVKHESR
jgi:hypothetical protein